MPLCTGTMLAALAMKIKTGFVLSSGFYTPGRCM